MPSSVGRGRRSGTGAKGRKRRRASLIGDADDGTKKDDILVSGGILVDSKQMKLADVRIKDGLITDIEPPGGAGAAEPVIDATGKPAEIFGLCPRKRVLRAGSDADLVVFDPTREDTVRAMDQHTKTDYTMYEGRRCLGAPILVV